MSYNVYNFCHAITKLPRPISAKLCRNVHQQSIIITAQNKCFLGGILESECLFLHVYICVQNNNFCQSTGEGIESHLVTAVVFFGHG